MSLQVKGIRISNVLGVESLEIRPGKVTVIRGANGTGKTSILEAIKAATRGGHDATLLRNGAELGETVLVLDDDSRIHKRITAEGSKQRYVVNGEASSRAPSEIAKLIDALSVSPIDFLNAPKKQQVATLLEALPIPADIEKLAELTGGPVAPELAKAHALVAIDSVHKAIFDNRTGVNGQIKAKKGTISQLEAAIPAELADTDSVDETALEQLLADADSARDTELQRIETKLSGLEGDWDAKLADLQKQIDAVKADREAKRAGAEKQRQRARDACAAARKPAEESLAVIRSNRDAAARARATRDTITKMQDDLKTLVAETEAATAALAALDAYKIELLENLPIPGLEVRGGDIYFGAVPFERLNTAKRMRIAVEIAKLRAGTLGLVCVDGAEALDDEAFSALCDQARESDVQLVVTRVSDGPLEVETQP